MHKGKAVSADAQMKGRGSPSENGWGTFEDMETCMNTEPLSGPRSDDDRITALDERLLIANCAKQDLSRLGMVQPFACLLLIQKSNKFIVACSENTVKFLKLAPESLLGRHAHSALGSRLARILDVTDYSDSNTRHFCSSVAPGGPEFHIAVSQDAHNWIVEFEEAKSENSARLGQDRPLPHLSDEGSLSISRILEFFSGRFAEIVPFDRMMVYRFDEDWSGTVIFEINRGYENSFLDLHFPASDLPANARELYLKVPSRYIKDTEASDSALHSLRAEAADLSLVRSRACSETHLRYLRNMGVRSSYSLAIQQGDSLWGLVAFHAQNPMELDLSARLHCERLVRSMSINMLRLQAEERMQTHENFNSFAISLVDSVDYSKPSPECFLSIARPLMETIGATGLIIAKDGKLASHGITPPSEDVHVLLDLLPTFSRGRVAKLNSIARLLPDAARYAPQAAGMLVACSSPLHDASSSDVTFLWFRPEYVEQVRWAGKSKEVSGMTLAGGLQVLNPRNSFQVWTEERRNTCADWGNEAAFKATMWIHNLLEKETF